MTLHAQIEYWKHRAEVAEAKVATLRSPAWPHARSVHLKKEPLCQACGSTEHLEVHHIVPFHQDKSKELVESNLITLCETLGRNCHFKLGHFGNWHNYNPHVRSDADAALRGKAP